MQRPITKRRGFTIAEIMIVVTIMGILASTVIAMFQGIQDDARMRTFATTGHVLVKAAERYRFDHGDYLEDAASGVLPAGFEDYIIESVWDGPTPIGGVWDTELNSYGIISALGVHFNGVGDTRDDEFMQELDLIIDYGDLAAGGLRKIDSNRYYYIIAE